MHLVFALLKRLLIGTYHGAASPKHLGRYLDEFAFRFNRRNARAVTHRFQRLVEIACLTPPATYRDIVRG